MVTVKIVVEKHPEGYAAYPLGIDGVIVGQGESCEEALGLVIVREREHIAMVRDNSDGSKTPLTLPNHPAIKGASLRAICRQSRISREDFLAAYQNS